jgi:hypothetical protein
MRRTSVAALSLALLSAGCGTGASERDTQTVVDSFETAVAGSNGDRACRQLTGELRSSLEDMEGKPCETAVLALGLSGGGHAEHGRVYITSALVKVPGHGAAFLDQTRQGWRISAAGCVRKPDRDEYRCKLED